MSKVYLEDTSLTAIADAIRAKNGETTTYTPAEMPNAIAAIESGGLGIDWENDIVTTVTSASSTLTLPDGYTINDIKLIILPTNGSGTYGSSTRYFFAAPGVLTPAVSGNRLDGITMGAYGSTTQSGSPGISLYTTDHQEIFNYSNSYIMQPIYLLTTEDAPTILQGRHIHPTNGTLYAVKYLAVGKALIVLKNKEVA